MKEKGKLEKLEKNMMIRFGKKMYKEIGKEAKKRGLTKSKLIRSFIRFFLFEELEENLTKKDIEQFLAITKKFLGVIKEKNKAIEGIEEKISIIQGELFEETLFIWKAQTKTLWAGV